MKHVSVFQNYTCFDGNKPLFDVLNGIKQGDFKKQVNLVREYTAKGDKPSADFYKNQLPAFTPSGTFDNGRRASLLVNYNQLIILDLDKLNQTDLDQAKAKAIACPHTLAAFVSPSGNGLKIIVPINSNAEQHKEAYTQVASFYQELLSLTIDQSGKDVSRLCFISYDSKCYINEQAEAFNVNIVSKQVEIKEQTKPKPCIQVATAQTTDWQTQFQECIEFTDNKESYHEGNRNNYIHLLACNCNRAGMPQHIAESNITSSFDLPQNEIMASVKSAYNETHEHAKFAKSANLEQSKDELLKNMLYLPDVIFNNLPSILKNGCQVFTDPRERDVFFTGALGILSGCLRNVCGLYNGAELYSNLYVFIIAPAASGKGALTFAKTLGDAYHENLLNESRTKKKAFEIEMRAFKQQSSKGKENDNSEMPEAPPFKILFIPANNSSSRVIQHLQDSDSQGIFCETEADSMGANLKQDWGNYSDLLRKAFHHEKVSLSRKTNDEFVEIKQPRLSVALSGTPSQVQNLIKSSEDGLFSRFLFYTFKTETVWRQAGATMQGVNLTQHFNELSIKVLHFVEYLESQSHINFNLTESQWDKLNAFGNKSLTTLTTSVNENLASTSKRLAVILYRICMIISGLRYFDNGEAPQEFICSDEDFEAAFLLIQVYEQHSVHMFNELPRESASTSKTLKQFFDALPAQFQRKEAIAIAQNFNIAERTADEYLKKLLSSKWLDNSRYGWYDKAVDK
jgi:hypothetical protein